MVSSVSGTHTQQVVSSQPPKHTPPAASKSQSEPPKDTVELSAAARKARSGDVDRDGGSH